MMSITLNSTSSGWMLDLGENENRFTPRFLTEIDQALDSITGSSEPAALMIMATGKFFSNGLDLESLRPSEWDWDAHVAAVQSMFCPSAHAAGTNQGFFCIPAVNLKIPSTLGMTSLINEKLTPRAALDVMTTG